MSSRVSHSCQVAFENRLPDLLSNNFLCISTILSGGGVRAVHSVPRVEYAKVCGKAPEAHKYEKVSRSRVRR